MCVKIQRVTLPLTDLHNLRQADGRINECFKVKFRHAACFDLQPLCFFNDSAHSSECKESDCIVGLRLRTRSTGFAASLTKPAELVEFYSWCSDLVLLICEYWRQICWGFMSGMEMDVCVGFDDESLRLFLLSLAMCAKKLWGCLAVFSRLLVSADASSRQRAERPNSITHRAGEFRVSRVG